MTIRQRTALSIALSMLLSFACGGSSPEGTAPGPREGASSLPNALLVSLAALDQDAEGKPVPLPARLGVLRLEGGEWLYRALEDKDSNVFHKAMSYRPQDPEGGILTFGGTGALVKLWRPGAEPEVLWQADFGGRFSRMRDAEVADLYGDGTEAIAVATHDQGVVAVLRPQGGGGFEVAELDRKADTFVHEIEIGDLDGDGVPEVYATPSAPNKLDGTPQPGEVVRYVPAAGEGPVVVSDLGDRHAKEILVDDVDGDGRDELYVSVEAVAGGRVEIRRYDLDTPPAAGELVATLDDKLCRFLTSGDVDGDGRKEMVAAAYKSGLWLLRPGADGEWSQELIDADSSGFEHAALLADLDEDGTDELYVASDRDKEIRRYLWRDGTPTRELLHRYEDGLSRFTWNLMPVPARWLPGLEGQFLP